MYVNVPVQFLNTSPRKKVVLKGLVGNAGCEYLKASETYIW